MGRFSAAALGTQCFSPDERVGERVEEATVRELDLLRAHLIEHGFEVAVVKDATAAAKVPDGNGYETALVNFRFMANAVWTTEEATAAMSGG